MKQKFKPGQKVRHIAGVQEMVVVEYRKILLAIYSSIGPNDPIITTDVICSWVDGNNVPHRSTFPEASLVLVDE